jgi:hypothetical protein
LGIITTYLLIKYTILKILFKQNIKHLNNPITYKSQKLNHALRTYPKTSQNKIGIFLRGLQPGPAETMRKRKVIFFSFYGLAKRDKEEGKKVDVSSRRK